MREPHRRARLSPPGRGERWCVLPRGSSSADIDARPERFAELLPVPLLFLPPAALDPAERVSAKLPPVHGVQRGAGAGRRPHSAQPGHTPGQRLQQLRAACGCPSSHCHQRLSLQHHAHLRECRVTPHSSHQPPPASSDLSFHSHSPSCFPSLSLSPPLSPFFPLLSTQSLRVFSLVQCPRCSDPLLHRTQPWPSGSPPCCWQLQKPCSRAGAVWWLSSSRASGPVHTAMPQSRYAPSSCTDLPVFPP